MEKQGDMPPPYQTQPGGPGPQPMQGYGGAPPPQYQYAPQAGGYPPPPPQHGGQPGGYPQPPPGYGQPPQQYQQYPNVVVQQPMVVPAVQGPMPPDHMAAAIFVTLCCFWPTGVIAIMKASEAKNAWYRGDSGLAHTQARSAKTMITVSIVAGICTMIMLGIFLGVYISMINSTFDNYDNDY